MEQNKRECKIVQDLLPNYVENLTDEVTNEYIQEHIKTCDECRKALESVNTDIQVEELNQDREIKYLKKVRSKIRRTIMFALLIIVIVASCAIWYSYIQCFIFPQRQKGANQHPFILRILLHFRSTGSMHLVYY